jgi:hypothetical protein
MTLNIISCLYQHTNAFADCHSMFAIIRPNGEGVPISFPSGSDGLAIITDIRLSLWF